MAADAFRSQMNSLGWSRREEPPISTAPTPLLSRLNPFAPSGGYVRLPTTNVPPSQPTNEPGLFNMSRFDRLLAFSICNIGALACFGICFAFFPIMMTRPRKFAVLWTVGSALFLASWAIMQGPQTYAAHLLSGPRRPFTAAYFGTIALTLWFSLGVGSTILTLLAAVAQVVALMWYLVSYFPMGTSALRAASSFGASQVGGWINS